MAHEVDVASWVTSDADVEPIEPPSLTWGMWALLELGMFPKIARKA